MENMQVRAQKELVLLHRALHKKRLTSTVEWLNARGWISAHHHVSVGGVFFINFTLSCFCSWLVCLLIGWLAVVFVHMLNLYVVFVCCICMVVFVCCICMFGGFLDVPFDFGGFTCFLLIFRFV